MADVVVARSALSALSVNNAQNAAPSTSRLSMGAKRSVSRPSLSGRRSSLHSIAVSGAARLSISSSTTTASAAAGGRRSSTHSRPSSIAGSTHSSAATRSDPRPMHDKAYLKEQIHKIILYCISHQFDRPLSPKLLLSPTAKDFRHLMLFFFQQVDPNYAFGPSVEEDIKRTMKLLGYPFALSKNALQAAGTPHTWPALLLMMAWIVDVLNYDDKVEGGEEGEAAGGGGSGGGGVGDVEPHPEKLFFAYLTQSYAAFIQGNEQQTAQLEEQLANTFGVRHASASAEVVRLESLRSSLLSELSAMRAAGVSCAVLRQKKAEYASDVLKFESLIRDVTQHLQAVRIKVTERQTEAADKQQQETELREEQQLIQQTLAAQEFTPLQIQSMMHQQQMMQEALAELEQQKNKMQSDRWSVERSLDQRMGELSALVSEFNALGVAIEILPSTAKHANGQSLHLSMTADVHAVLCEDSELSTPSQVIQPDLKLLIKPVLLSLTSALSGRVASLTSSSRVLHEEWVHLTEVRAERQRSLQSLEQALAKREEALKASRTEMNDALKAMVEEVEAMEGKVNEERSRRSREEREAAEKALTDAEADKGRREAEWRAEKQREQSALWRLIEDLVNHAERIHTQLAHIQQQTLHIRHHTSKLTPPPVTHTTNAGT